MTRNHLSFRFQPVVAEKLSKEDTCGICLLGMEKGNAQGRVVAHLGSGKAHPMHALCIAEWLEKSKTCPFCIAEINSEGLLSWAEVALREIKAIAKDAFFGAVSGFMIAAAKVVTAEFQQTLFKHTVLAHTEEIIAGGILMVGAVLGSATAVALGAINNTEVKAFAKAAGGLGAAAAIFAQCFTEYPIDSNAKFGFIVSSSSGILLVEGRVAILTTLFGSIFGSMAGEEFESGTIVSGALGGALASVFAGMCRKNRLIPATWEF